MLSLKEKVAKTTLIVRNCDDKAAINAHLMRMSEVLKETVSVDDFTSALEIKDCFLNALSLHVTAIDLLPMITFYTLIGLVFAKLRNVDGACAIFDALRRLIESNKSGLTIEHVMDPTMMQIIENCRTNMSKQWCKKRMCTECETVISIEQGKWCSRCLRVCYCSAECQAKDWYQGEHKKTCGKKQE
jgi:hypothetical protein